MEGCKWSSSQTGDRVKFKQLFERDGALRETHRRTLHPVHGVSGRGKGAKTPSSGRGFPAGNSRTTRCGFSSLPWLTTWQTSSGGLPCREVTALAVDDVQGEAGQDRRQNSEALQVCDLPACRGGHSEGALCHDSWSDSSARLCSWLTEVHRYVTQRAR